MTADRQARESEETVRIFIGSGDASLLERKTLIHSIRRNTSRQLEIWSYNGTRHTVETEAGEQLPCPSLPPLSGHRFATEFSLFRYLIPQLCHQRGKAVYLDSDMIVCGDIGELYDTSLRGYDFAACPDAYPGIAPHRWALSVMVIDCSSCRFDLEAIFSLIQRGVFSYAEFAQMGRRARRFLPYRIRQLSAAWNHFDRLENTTKLIHYTDLQRQPWKYRYHPFGEVWFDNFRQAFDSGSISTHDVRFAIEKGFARPDLLLGNRGVDTLLTRLTALFHRLVRMLRDSRRQAARIMAGTHV